MFHVMFTTQSPNFSLTISENCVPGKKRDGSDNDCVSCDSGWMSGAGASVCTECPVVSLIDLFSYHLQTECDDI